MTYSLAYAPPRFRSKVSVQDECWVWTGARSERGYGRFNVQGKNLHAYRWAYEYFVGDVPNGLEIDHLCRNKSCVNPAHLEPVTHRENIIRWAAVARTRCPNGHKRTPETWYERGPYCRICKRDKQRAARRSGRQVS